MWDAYVRNHPCSTLYHLSGWQNVIGKTYSHKAYYLMAVSEQDHGDTFVVGVLPLVHMKHFMFGNSLVSIPFFDLGGVLADNEEIEKSLLYEAMKLAHDLEARSIEFRHIEPLSCLSWDDRGLPAPGYEHSAVTCITRSHKVRMLLQLTDSSDMLMKSFKAKLRSQIKVPVKSGLEAKIGGGELLDNFYSVFVENMRDLGSPVHSKKLIQNVLEEFSPEAKIVIVHKESRPLACSFIIGYKDVLENPWASALKDFSKLSPNMLLYWTMLEYACNNGYAYFDFGRSSPDEGTFKFKEQWGALPTPLQWQYISLNGSSAGIKVPEKSKFERAIHYWQKLPVGVTRIIGPMVRKHIPL